MRHSTTSIVFTLQIQPSEFNIKIAHIIINEIHYLEFLLIWIWSIKAELTYHRISVLETFPKVKPSTLNQTYEVKHYTKTQSNRGFDYTKLPCDKQINNIQKTQHTNNARNNKTQHTNLKLTQRDRKWLRNVIFDFVPR